ncbi:MAG: aldo/keto reductase [Mariniphaga sp.]
MIKDLSERVKLNNGVEIPWLGLGVLRLKEGGEVERAVQTALENGYRLIDNAAVYHNEKGVGRGIRASGIPREELFLSSKIANDQQGYHSTFKAFQRSLDWLQTDYLDLYLIHWPKAELSLETWKAMEELYEKGKVRAIGVSNFWIHHLEYFLPKVNIVPAVNQVEFHPEMAHTELLRYCKSHNIQVEAWSPVMQGKVSKIPTLRQIAEKHEKTPFQVTLRWDLQKEVVTIPRSGKPEEIIENAQIFDFELSQEEVAAIDSLNRNKKIFPYYDKIPFLIKALLNNKQKARVFEELIKATAYKVKNRFKMIFEPEKQPKALKMKIPVAGKSEKRNKQ